jgi:hypothetical protein
MDAQDIVEHARSRLDHAAAHRVLREKYEARMIFGHNGGLFRATPEMISFLSLFHDQNIVVKDLYDTPIQVSAAELYELMRGRLQEQMNAWLIEHQALHQKA